MKKSLIALAALATVSGASMAQVTLSGVMDLGVRYTSAVGSTVSKVSLADGDAARLIFSANEDLGGGLRALANVQLRFDPTTGYSQGRSATTSATGTLPTPVGAASAMTSIENTARPLFQGETRVGLSGGFGTVMLGRGVSALNVPNGGNSDPWGVTTVATSPYAVGFATDYATGGEGRIDRAFWYTSPNISGLTLSASMSPFKVTGSTLNNSNGASKTHYSVAAVYSAGPLVIGLGTEQNRAADTITQLFGNYNAGIARIFFSTARVNGGTPAEQANAGTYLASGVSKVAADGTISNHTIGATIPMGALSYRVGFSTWNGNGLSTQKTDSKLGLGVRYDLSKRTYVYSDLAQTSRKNNGAVSSTTVTATANTANTKNNQFDLGIRHSF
jgi:predicted porin